MVERTGARLLLALWVSVGVPAVAATPDGGVALTAEAAWTWVTDRLPEEKARFSFDRPLVEKLLAWGTKLTVFDLACRPLVVRNTAEALVGLVNVETHREGALKKVHSDELVFDASVTAVCGSDETWERRGGRWELVASGGTGCAHQLGHLLSRVTATEAWYGGERATVEVVCAPHTSELQTCTDGTTRTCTTCSALALNFNLRSRGGSSQALLGHGMSVAGVDCSQPCAPDELGASLPAVNAALSGVGLMKLDLEPHPTLFRTLEACRSYRRRHRVSSDELSPLW